MFKKIKLLLKSFFTKKKVKVQTTKERKRLYYLANKDRIRTQQAWYYKNNREEINYKTKQRRNRKKIDIV